MKVPFNQLYMEVEKLYNKEFQPSEIQSINEHCDFIRSFIESCGWDVESYIRSMFGFDQKVNEIN